MKRATVEFPFDLYVIHDRTWEGCMVSVTASFPEEYEARLKNMNDELEGIDSADFKFESAKLQPDTLKYMNSRRANIESILKDVAEHFDDPDWVFEEVSEHMVENGC